MFLMAAEGHLSVEFGWYLQRASLTSLIELGRTPSSSPIHQAYPFQSCDLYSDLNCSGDSSCCTCFGIVLSRSAIDAVGAFA